MRQTYCDKRCQKNNCKMVHQEQCEKLQQVFVLPPAWWREAKRRPKEYSGGGGGGGGGAAATAGGGGGGVGAVADDEEVAHPCPICLDNEDDAYVDGQYSGQCFACGQLYCGACKANVRAMRKCPTCRAPFHVSGGEKFKRLWKLVHDRSPGRHTPVAQNALGRMYAKGEDDKEAVAWYRKRQSRGMQMRRITLVPCTPMVPV